MNNKPVAPRLFALLVLGFILATIVGTLSHEMGHIAVAKTLGYKTKLYYAAMDYNIDQRWKPIADYYDAHKTAILSKGPSPEKEYFMAQRAAIEKEMFYITLGGPLQTMITGTIGLTLLWVRRKKIREQGLRVADWLFVLLAFFWSRQVFNFASALLRWVVTGKRGGGGDEFNIDSHLGIPLITTNLLTGIMALALLIWVVFYIIPKMQRLTFIVSGFVGSALGWGIWMYWLGPALLN